MKNLLINISIAIVAAGSLASCSLDKEVDLTYTSDQVYGKFENTRGALAHLYTYLPDAFSGYNDGQFLGASRDCMTDNCVSFWNVHRYHSIQSGSYDATNHWFATTYWTNDIKGIREANTFMLYANKDVVGNAAKNGDDNHLYNRWMAEARFMRAMLEFDLIGYFGAVPIEDHVLTNAEAASMTRTPAPEALQWVANECDTIINSGALPFRYSNENENWGHINGAAVYALKSRALLYLASPLNNPTNDKSLWQKAADAALAFIKANQQSSNPYRLYTTTPSNPDENYYKCFASTPHLNQEFILSRSEWSTRVIEQFNAPCGFTGSLEADGRNNPTENLIECYETKNGKFIDEDPTYDPQNPYENRDPRLDQTILHQGSIWGDPQQSEQRAVNVTYGSDNTDYSALHGGTTTGYYVKKFVYNISFKYPTDNLHACPIFRYAEILLNAAEALNEAGHTDEAYQYVNQVRARVGMPAYKGMTQDQLRERIQNERRIEFAFEDMRFFDARRWKLYDKQSASSETSLPIRKQIYHLYSVQVTPDAATKYTIVPNSMHATYAFQTPKDYYFPVPDETYKKCPSLGQNAGWELTSNK